MYKNWLNLRTEESGKGTQDSFKSRSRSWGEASRFISPSPSLPLRSAAFLHFFFLIFLGVAAWPPSPLSFPQTPQVSFPAVCWSIVFYPETFTLLFPKSPHTRDNTHTRSHTYLYILYMYTWIQKRANLWDTEARGHTCRLSGCVAGHVCASSCHWCSFKKSTSLPRKLSAIADLNPHRYLSAASSFGTAVAAVTKQVHTFLFFRNKPEGLSRALSGHLNAYSAGFLQKRDTSRESMSTQSYLRIIVQNRGGAGLTYDHGNREWLFFIPSLPCLWCCWVKIVCRTFFFFSFFFSL